MFSLLKKFYYAEDAGRALFARSARQRQGRGGFHIRPETCGKRRVPRAGNVRPYRSQKSLFPLSGLEAGQDETICHQQRALDQHTVRGQQGDLLLLAHSGQLIFKAQIFVDKAARIKEPLDGQAARSDPCPQLVSGRVVLFNMAGGVDNAVFIQPFFSFLAGGARRVLRRVPLYFV